MTTSFPDLSSSRPPGARKRRDRLVTWFSSLSLQEGGKMTEPANESGSMITFTNAPINVKPAVRGGGRQGIGWDFDRSLWPGGRAFEFSCCPGGRDIWIFVRARDHKSFLGVGNLVIFDLTFLPGGREFDSNLLENVKIPPYAPPPPPPAWHW